MPKPLIKDRQIIDDAWTLVRDAEAGAPAGPAILPLALWKTLRDSRAAADTGVWLAPADDPAELAGAVAELPVIAVDFPQFADGRGYSIGRLLRERYGFAGELRAIGDVLRDQLYPLEQVGFNAFSLREDRDPAKDIAGLHDFSLGYQQTFLRQQPLFRHAR
ncbi:MAG: hypothetical protein B7Z23_12505 [Pseudomonadales bacterium 32-61-5]|jgi:uncharacterized protein (DUF934 family)|uniref:DUF934 domain-containing protein n=1 Tax=Rivihabitans pingtungensis TaxID=1054498 RepID=UPI000BD27510|nr:DUF934 domain-containing protein [Rivihabitans pingtungensis]MCK6438030.1 DUF934 domain-containing protein [Rivihabitans pingtungensis]OYW88749.1 MAG: hypothetical protein B7Z23_12505 [Pseudomonadales bacterium 32-61-5]HNX70578.1 DUF934 domain-containing protein [Rivihabitans pingtungensis]